MRRLAIAAATVLVAVAGVVAVIAFFNARDDATVGEPGRSGPGRQAPGATGRTLEQGNVVLLYGDPSHRERLRALARDVAGPPEPSLVHAGQAILVQRRAGTDGVVAEAYRRRLHAAGPEDPRLRAFAERWLGRGAMTD